MTAKAPKYAIHNVQGGNLVRSTKEQIYYYSQDEALYKIVDIHLLGYEWVQGPSLVNSSDNPLSRTETMTRTLRVKTGEQFAQKLNITAGFSGLKVNAKLEVGLEHTTFTENEVTESVEVKQPLSAKPHTAVYLYQKVYHFKVHVWFQLDAWNKMWTVGKRGKDELLEVLSMVDIATKDLVQADKKILGAGTFKIQPVKRAAEQKNIKRLEDCTARCQNYLRDNGIGGSSTLSTSWRSGMPK